jgi:hypothetical protein
VESIVSDKVRKIGRRFRKSGRRGLVWTNKEVVDVAKAEFCNDFVTLVLLLGRIRKNTMTWKLIKLTACLDELHGRLNDMSAWAVGSPPGGAELHFSISSIFWTLHI